MKKARGRLVLLLLVIVISIVACLPSYPDLYQGLPAWARSIIPNKGIASDWTFREASTW